MTVEVKVPVRGEGAENYVLAQWHAADADDVTEGEVLFEVETAKATYDVLAPGSGELRITVEAGAEVSAHDVVGLIDADDGTTPTKSGEVRNSDAARRSEAGLRPAPDEHASATATAHSSSAAHIATSVAPSHAAASPRARAAARRAGTDLTDVPGTGPGGRIVARDVPQQEASTVPPAPAASITPPPALDRRVIARRLTEAAAIPSVTLHSWADGTQLRAVVDRLGASGARWGLPRITVGDLLALVVSRVLPRHPLLNAHWVDEVQPHEQVHLGIAVDAPWGLVVPVINDASRLSLGEIAAARADLAQRAKIRQVAREEITGSTFTLTNLGAVGVEHFTPLLNPPEVAILGIGTLVAAPPAGSSTNSFRLPLSLTFDHRAVDGAPAGRFLREVAEGISDVDLLLAI